MADTTLGTKQRAVLLLLMASGGELSNKDLGALSITGRERRPLNDGGLMTTDTSVRPFVHELTDRGWRWCAEEAASGSVPPRSGSFGVVLYGVLAQVARYAEDKGLHLGDLFPPPPVDLDALLRAAYADLAAKPGEWAGLAELRAAVGPDADREAVDRALVALGRAPGVTLAPESNRKALTPADHAAALRVGGEDKHLVAIEGA
jgi:hypothetical protein